MNVPDWLREILFWTAWPMEAPAMFGTFHLFMLVLCTAVPYFLAKRSPVKNRQLLVKRLSACGWILAGTEVYKQLFYYCVVNGMHYDFWFFPFQLCSVAMYLCILLPLFRGRTQNAMITFLYSFSLPGALLALVFPEDMLRSWWTMTIHGFFWHAMLVYIAFTVFFSGQMDDSDRGFRNSALLYILLGSIAVVLNLVLRPFAVYGAKPNLFYLSPYEKSGQFFFSLITERFGIPAELILYVLLYLLLCYAFHLIARKTGRT
ncbi:MAG: YwaF family protein [Solobacterium sp.]|nr:YwaF family protein [Solobacterium sp.]